MIWKLWGQIRKLWTADSETMIWKRWFRNYEIRFGKCERRIIRKLWFGNYEIRFGNSEQRIRKLWVGKHVIQQLDIADLETMCRKTMSSKLWMGNFCRHFGNWKEQHGCLPLSDRPVGIQKLVRCAPKLWDSRSTARSLFRTPDACRICRLRWFCYTVSAWGYIIKLPDSARLVPGQKLLTSLIRRLQEINSPRNAFE